MTRRSVCVVLNFAVLFSRILILSVGEQLVPSLICLSSLAYAIEKMLRRQANTKTRGSYRAPVFYREKEALSRRRCHAALGCASRHT